MCKYVSVNGTSLYNAEKLSRNNWILFALMTVSTLRVSLNKQTRQQFKVYTLDPRDRQRVEQKVEIEFAESHGLPNPTDEIILLGLVELTRFGQHGRQTLQFPLSALIDVLQWHQWSAYKNRMETSLNRWAQIKLTFQKGCWEETKEQWNPYTIGIFNKVEFQDKEVLVEWSAPVFESLAAAHFAFVNLTDYLKFKNAVARRIYLLTHQDLETYGSVEYLLRDFAEKDVRLRSDYSYGHIRDKLKKGLKELVETGYIKAAQKWERFSYRRNGEPVICFERGPLFTKKEKNKAEDKRPADMKPLQVEPRDTSTICLTPESPTLITPPVIINGGNRVGYSQPNLPLEFSQADTPKKIIHPSRKPAKPSSSKSANSPVNPVKMAGERAMILFWESLPPDRREQEEQQALSRANPMQLELLQQNTQLGCSIREDLLRNHFIRLMADQIC